MSPRATIRQLEGTDAILDREALKSGFIDTLKEQELKESVGVFKEAKGSWCHYKRSESPSATIRKLAGYDAILDREALQGGFGGPLEPLGKRPSVARGKMESAPLQKVSVAHCDHTTAGRRQMPFLAGRLWKASLEVRRSHQAIRKAF